MKNTIAILLLIVCIFLNNCAEKDHQRFLIPTSGMEPAILAGTEHRFSKASHYNRDDIIAYYSPAEQNQIYCKRIIAIAGDTVEIRNRQVFINGVKTNPDYDVVRMCLIRSFYPSFLDSLGIAYEQQHYDLITANLTDNQFELLRNKGVKIRKVDVDSMSDNSSIFPEDPEFTWKLNNFGPLWIPQAGAAIPVDEEEIALYGELVSLFESENLQDYQGREYQFKRDYFFAMGDNRDNSIDARMEGPSPVDHIIGKLDEWKPR